MELPHESRLPRFLGYHIAALLLLGSLLLPPTDALWEQFDTWCFSMLNGSVHNRPIAQIFWALANVKITDLYGAFFMLSFSLLYVFEKGRIVARERLAQFFYILIWGEIGILSAKEVVYPLLKWCDQMRPSPSAVITPIVALSKVVPWLKVKDVSHCSFPGDHALLVLQWAAFISFFAGWRYGIVAFLSSIFFILPRLIAGAHWVSDGLVGSLFLVLVILAWATCTPVYPWGMRLLQKISAKIIRAPAAHPTA